MTRKAKKLKPAKFGSVVVPIYQTRVGKYTTYTVAATVDGKRERFQRASIDAAREKALDIAKRIAKSETNALKLTNSQFSGFQRAQQNIHGIPKPIELVTAEYAEAYKINPDVPFVEQARYYAQQHPGQKSISIRAALDQMLAEKADLRAESLHDLKVRLTPFADHFQMPVAQLQESEAESWLAALTNRGTGARKGTALSRRSRKNYRAALNTFLAFLKAKKYLRTDFTLSGRAPKCHLAKIIVISPEQFQSLLVHAGPLLPTVAIMALAGVRSKAANNLDWSDIHFESKLITVEAETAKLGEQYFTPILPNLLEILLPLRKKNGRIFNGSVKNMSKRLARLGKKSGFKWSRNILRKSYISYRIRLASVEDVARDANTSAVKIFSNYRSVKLPDGRLVTKELAEQYFSTVTKVSQILPMPRRAA